MKKLMNVMRALRNDEDGASFVEYTVLLGVILAASILVISAVGNYANEIWVAVSGTMASAVAALPSG